MPKLLIATRNPGKLREYRQLLGDIPFELVSLDDLGIPDEVEETGETFEENARLKAATYGALSGVLTLADDSGLAVDALGGEPGVRSARYGEQSPQLLFIGKSQEEDFEVGLEVNMSDQDRVRLLLRNLEGVPWPRRTARFRCVIAISTPPSLPDRGEELENPHLVVGAVAGMIEYEPRGDEGFGYDPVFYLPSYERTMAELPLEEKNRISHRADASRKAVAHLKRLVES